MTPFKKAKVLFTAIPSNLNGRQSIQKTGYSSKAKIASGQQSIKRMIQVMVDHHLPDPICEGSLLNIGTKKGK